MSIKTKKLNDFYVHREGLRNLAFRITGFTARYEHTENLTVKLQALIMLLGLANRLATHIDELIAQEDLLDEKKG